MRAEPSTQVPRGKRPSLDTTGSQSNDTEPPPELRQMQTPGLLPATTQVRTSGTGAQALTLVYLLSSPGEPKVWLNSEPLEQR